jgi:hypothetical protein
MRPTSWNDRGDNLYHRRLMQMSRPDLGAVLPPRDSLCEKAPSIKRFTELDRAEWDNSLIFSLLFDPQTNLLPSAVAKQISWLVAFIGFGPNDWDLPYLPLEVEVKQGRKLVNFLYSCLLNARFFRGA